MAYTAASWDRTPDGEEEASFCLRVWQNNTALFQVWMLPKPTDLMPRCCRQKTENEEAKCAKDAGAKSLRVIYQCSCLRHVRLRISCNFNSKGDLEQLIEDECRYARVREVKRMNKHNSVHLSAWIMHRQFRCGTLWKSNASEAWKL